MSLTKVSYSMIQGAYVNVLDYGADPTGVLDSWQAIQNAIDDSIYGFTGNPANGNKNVVYLPAGVYKISDTLQLGYGTSFASVIVEGAGYMYRGEDQFNGTALIADFDDRPAVNFQGGRGSGIRNLAIIGPQKGWYTSIPDADLSDEANWTDPSIPVNSYSRYAPLAAITIDAYSGTQPAIHYPAVPYPTWLGSVAQYGKNFSSQCLIENIFIDGFVAGAVIQPGDSDGNGDFTVFRHMYIENCKYGISVGNAQSRNVSISDVVNYGMWTVLVNDEHGKQKGQFNGTISNLSASTCMNLISFQSVFSGPLTFLHLYCEATWRIGDLLGSYSENFPIIFQSCSLNFQNQTDTIGVPASLISAQTNPEFVIFKGCQITSYASVFVALTNKGVRFDDCVFASASRYGVDITAPYIRYAHNATCDGVVVGVDIAVPTNSFVQYEPTLLTNGTRSVSQVSTTTRRGRTYCLPFTTKQVLGWNGGYANHTSFQGAIDKTTNVTSITFSGLTMILTVNGGYGMTDALAEMYGFCPGDILFDQNTGTTFFIIARTGSQISAVRQNNYKLVGASYVDVVPFSTATGFIYSRNTRLYTGIGVLKCTLTAGSPNIPSFTDDSGSQLGGIDLTIGDRIAVVANSYYPFDDTTSRMTSVAGPIVIDGNANYSFTDKPIDIFISTPPANA